MKVVFISNYINHHQLPFSEAMSKLTERNYRFIQTEKMSDERRALGWGLNDLPEYVVKSNENPSLTQELINDADFVICGSCPRILFKDRLKAGKIVFAYSERPWKNGFQWWKWPVRYYRHGKWYRHFKNYYMLCASAYTASDYAITGCFRGKTYKWGYFPEVKRYAQPEKILEGKHHRRVTILWVARLIELKHPEIAIAVAERLKIEGYDFELNMIGIGQMEEQCRRMIAEKKLNDQVHLLGSMKPDQVREHMEKSEIFLFTSDRKEGWGAVLNESMNSMCAVVANDEIGSVPFLMRNGVNGLTYHKSFEELYGKVKYLMDNPEQRDEFGYNAYKTMINEWNAEIAAERLLQLYTRLNEKSDTPFVEGPCSKAGIIKG